MDTSAKTPNLRASFATALAIPTAVAELPELVVDLSNLPETARALAQYLAKSPTLFQRGSDLVKVVHTGQGVAIVPLNAHSVVNEAHEACRPVIYEADSGKTYVTVPHRVANLLLNHPKNEFRVLRGISWSPLLSDDGSIRCFSGYDEETGYWCEFGQPLHIPECPTQEQAQQALLSLRRLFSTFPFADAATVVSNESSVVDLSVPPGQDESTLLTGVITAVCRQSLSLAPAIIIRAPQFSGAGTGKGHLVRAMAQIAYGIEPKAFTSNGERRELSKRIESALVESAPMIFLDNCNAEQLSSNVLAQVITESSVIIRLLGQTKMVSLTAKTFIALTGNAVQVSEDLARRFLVVELDAKREDPERRLFSDDFERNLRSRRRELLADALTIWRWGRVNRLERGLPLGSFEQWARWCRDPLLALGCTDPVRRIVEIKSEDPLRQRVVEFLSAWFAQHNSRSMKLRELDPTVRALAGRDSRQHLAKFVRGLDGTRVGGFVLTISKSAGKWGVDHYTVTRAPDTAEAATFEASGPAIGASRHRGS